MGDRYQKAVADAGYIEHPLRHHEAHIKKQIGRRQKRQHQQRQANRVHFERVPTASVTRHAAFATRRRFSCAICMAIQQMAIGVSVCMAICVAILEATIFEVAIFEDAVLRRFVGVDDAAQAPQPAAFAQLLAAGAALFEYSTGALFGAVEGCSVEEHRECVAGVENAGDPWDRVHRPVEAQFEWVDEQQEVEDGQVEEGECSGEDAALFGGRIVRRGEGGNSVAVGNVEAEDEQQA